MKLIKFENLEKACEDLNFELVNFRGFSSVIDKGGSNLRVINFSPDTPWAISFTDVFNVLECSEKAMLIKAITKDYEDYINED